MMMMILFSIFTSGWTLFACFTIFLFYKWSTWTYKYFEERNIPYEKPVPLLGNLSKLILRIESPFDFFLRIYDRFKTSSFYGIYIMRTPFIVITDPELIKKVTVKDFDHFINRRHMVTSDLDPLFGGGLFFMKDKKWKDMRNVLTPTFTGNKMRLMFPIIQDECVKAINYLDNQFRNESTSTRLELDMKEFFGRYTCNLVASTAFGLNVDSLADKDNEFYRMGMKVNNFSKWLKFKFFLMITMPDICKFLKLGFFDEKFSNYFIDLVMDTIKYRRENNVVRQDVLQLLITAQDNTKSDTIWTREDIAAQCFGFFIAGFDTTATLSCFCILELMLNSEVQEKLITEIDQVLENLEGKPLDYESLLGMNYLDMVVNETLRKWPLGVSMDRVCNKPYNLRNENTGEELKINEGDFLGIPVFAIHRNAKYYPDPDKFDPERFSPENKANIVPFTYLPFGVGPRNCIGFRLALLECKAVLFYILSKYKIERSPRLQIPIKLLTGNGFGLVPKGGFWFHIQSRK